MNYLSFSFLERYRLFINSIFANRLNKRWERAENSRENSISDSGRRLDVFFSENRKIHQAIFIQYTKEFPSASVLVDSQNAGGRKRAWKKIFRNEMSFREAFIVGWLLVKKKITELT